MTITFLPALLLRLLPVLTCLTTLTRTSSTRLNTEQQRYSCLILSRPENVSWFRHEV